MKLISASDAARELGISRARIHQLIEQGRIEGISKIGNQYAIQSPVKVRPGKPPGRHKYVPYRS